MNDKWLYILNNIDKKIKKCPYCNKESLKYKYTLVDNKNKMGYLDIICSNCKKEIHVSRIKIKDDL